MYFAWFRSTFLRRWKFQQINYGGPNFKGATNSAEQLNYLVPPLYFNFESFKDSNSSSFLTFESSLHDSRVLFSDFENFHTLKRGDLISWGKPILQVGWIIWFVLLYFNFKSWKDPNSLSFIRFQCILHDSGVLFSDY